jgi:hypothetical protein
MAPKKKNKKDKRENIEKKMVDMDKLKAFGIIKDPGKDDIEEVDGNDIHGGRDDADTTVDTHWPTTAGA